MKRAGILLLALALLGVLAAPGQAAQPAKVKAVAQSQSGGRAVLDGGADAQRDPARRRRRAPTRSGRRAAFRSPATSPPPTTPRTGRSSSPTAPSNYVCSGTALTSGNESVVWTAGHCVNEGPGAFYTNWAFVPAYKDGARPYGTWTARTLLTTSAWGQSGDFSYDVGAAVVNTNAGATLTDTVGSRGAAFNQPAEQHYLSHGYPAAPPFSGGRMFICEADLGTARQVGRPTDDGDRLRHDGRLVGRRLGGRQRRAVGQLLRLLEPAERDVRPVPGRRSRSSCTRARRGASRCAGARGRVRRPRRRRRS